MHFSIDDRHFRELMTESDDLQSDAMRAATADLGAYVDAATESRYKERRELRYGGALLGAGALGLGALAFANPAMAASSKNVMALQTAASIENLAVLAYQAALTLPYIGGSSANEVVKAFCTKTMAQHKEHGKAFNAAAKKLGGKVQTKPNPKYTPIVTAAVPKIKGPLDVVGLAITLEDVAAQTYVNNVGLVSTPDLRALFASVAGVESQHKAILLAVHALLKGGAPQLIALPPKAAKLPAAAGSVGFPNAFYPTKLASPAAEGAVK